MSVLWPFYLPFKPEYGMQEAGSEPLARTDFDYGVGRQRQMYTNPPSDFNVTLAFTCAQYEAFMYFYQDDLMNGASRFNVNIFIGTGEREHEAMITAPLKYVYESWNKYKVQLSVRVYDLTYAEQADLFDMIGYEP